MSSPVYSTLRKEMPDNACSEHLKVSKVKVEERGKQAVFLNPEKEPFVRTQVDGCLVKQATACDWWISRKGEDSVLVELKGCDVSKALDQIIATFEYLKNSGSLTKRMAALVVGRNPPCHPLFTSKLQRTKNRLSNEFKAPLHVVSGNFEYNMDCVLSHKGPFRVAASE